MEIEFFYLFFARTADMCLGTLRHLFAVRGRRKLAAAVAFAEILIYLFALQMILADEMSLVRMVVFAAGYAFGVYLGALVDERLGLGTRLVQVVVGSHEHELVSKLRQRLPVTLWNAEGRDGRKLVLQVHVKRRDHKRLIRAIKEMAPDAFVVDLEPRAWTGGLLRFD